MKTNIDFPDTLPNVSSWGYQPYDRRVKSDLNTGPLQFRRREAAFHATAPATWTFDLTQMRVFLDWLKNDLELSGKWFKMVVPFAGDEPWNELVVRFTSRPSWVAIGNNQWTVTANVEIFTPSTLPSDEPEPPEQVILWLDTFTGSGGVPLTSHTQDVMCHHSDWIALDATMYLDGLGDAAGGPETSTPSNKAYLNNSDAFVSKLRLDYPYTWELDVKPGILQPVDTTLSPFDIYTTRLQIRPDDFSSSFINLYLVPATNIAEAYLQVDINGATSSYPALQDEMNFIKVVCEQDGYTVTINSITYSKVSAFITNRFQVALMYLGLDAPTDGENPAVCTALISRVSLIGIELPEP